MPARPVAEPRHVLAVLGEYEESLSLLQRAYRKLAAAPAHARADAQREHDAALARARQVAERLRAAREAPAAA